MLVLSRHRDESIIIGDDIVITVVDIRGDKVRLGIAAPIEISVHRQEVYDAIQRENRQASRLEPNDARQIDRLNQPAAAARAAPASVRGHLRRIAFSRRRCNTECPLALPSIRPIDPMRGSRPDNLARRSPPRGCPVLFYDLMSAVRSRVYGHRPSCATRSRSRPNRSPAPVLPLAAMATRRRSNRFSTTGDR